MSFKFPKNIKFIGTTSSIWQNSNKSIKYIICLLILFFKLIKGKKETLVLAFQANMYAVIIAKLLITKIFL